MRTRTSPVVLGFIWGLFSMLLSFAVVSVFASLQVVFLGFPLFAYSSETQYILIGAIFLLSVVGAVGSGLVPRFPKMGGFFILLSSCGVAFLMFAPILMQSFSFSPIEAYGIKITPLALLITDFTLIVFTIIGLTGGILAFIPKRPRTLMKQPLPYAPAEAAPIKPYTPAPQPYPSEPAVSIASSAAEPNIVQAMPDVTDIDLMNLE